ncbi:MAG: accessory gene regulator B family protein [Bacilli bacterium]|nr:accessory gene regulator B family protein [Bacilli bacterium]MDD4547304.1 accessory gene regulator B family protein [Bacilli bacterium]
MKNQVLNILLNFITKHYPNYTEKQIATIRYGLEGIYITITKTIIIFAIAIYLNLFIELIILMLFYNLLRMFSFGLHATNGIICLIASTVLFIGTTYLCTIIAIGLKIKLISVIISILVFYKYSPADTKKRPIINTKRRNYYKIISTVTSIIYSYIIIFTNNHFIANALLFSLVIQSFLITPWAYIIFNQHYNNYLQYKKRKEDVCD